MYILKTKGRLGAVFGRHFWAFLFFLLHAFSASAFELKIPSFKPFDLSPLIPILDAQIPASSIILKSENVPHWKLLWDQAREAAREHDYSRAVSLYLELLALKDNLSEARWEMVLALLKDDRFAEASAALDVLLEVDRENEAYSMVQAFLKQREGHYERSFDLFRRLDDGPFADSPSVLAGKANALCVEGDNKGCFEYLHKLLEKRPNDKQVETNFVVLAYSLEKYEAALSYALALADSPESSPGILLLAARLLDRMERSDAAVVYWLKIAELFPDNIEARGRLASHYEDKERLDLALTHLLFLWERSARDGYLKRIGQAYLGLEKLPEALRYFELYAERRPYDKETVRNIIKIYAFLGDKVGTLRNLEHYFSIESQPEKDNLERAAALYDEGGFYKEAIPIYRRLLSMSPDDPDLLWSLADNLLAAGQDEDSLQVWKQLAAVAPGVVEVYRTMADLLQRLGRESELVGVLEVINELDPEDRDVVFQMSELYFRSGDFDACLEMLAKFDEGLRERPEFYQWRGTIRESRGQLAQALSDFEVLLREHPWDNDLRIRCVRLAGLTGNISILDPHARNISDRVEEYSAKELLLLAEALMNCRDFERARRVYRLVISGIARAQGEDDNVLLSLGRTAYIGIADSFLEENRTYEAEQVLRQAFAEKRGLDMLLRLFDLAIASNRLTDAKQWLAFAGEIARDNSWDIQMMRARLHLASGKEGAARREAEALERTFNERVQADANNDNRSIEKGEGSISGWLKDGADLVSLLVKLGDIAASHDFCLMVLDKDRTSIEAQVLLAYIHDLGGGFGTPLHIQMDGLDLSELLEYAVLLRRYGMAEELGRVSGHALELDSGLLWARIFLAEAELVAGSDNKALELYEGIITDFPKNYGVAVAYADLLFHRGELDKAEKFCRKFDKDNAGPEIIEIQARILWMKYEWDAAVDIYEEFLTPTVDQILEEKAKEIGLDLPLGEDGRSFWDIISFVPNEGNAVSAQVLDPLFFLKQHGPEWETIEKTAAEQYSRYRWQDKFAEELKARRSVQRREYFLAARQYERFASRYPDDISVLYDLAGVYSRLGRLGDEAALYEELAARQALYPELESNIARIRIKQRPYAELEYGYDTQEGRNGYKNMEKDWLGINSWYSPVAKSEVALFIERYNYQAADTDHQVRANRLLGSYRLRLLPGVSTFFLAGLHSLDHGDADTVLFQLGVDGKMGDLLSGEISLNRDIVDDTIASLTREIVREGLDAGLSLDLLPSLEIGGDYFITNYSDNNWTTGYDLRSAYTIFPEPVFLQVRYVYDFKESMEGIVGGVMRQDGFASDDHPYWAPKNYWQNSFGIFFKHTLAKDLFDRGTPRYYTAEYYFGHDSDGYAFQTLKGAVFAEITPEIFIKGSCELTTSQSFRQKQLAVSAAYRW